MLENNKPEVTDPNEEVTSTESDFQSETETQEEQISSRVIEAVNADKQAESLKDVVNGVEKEAISTGGSPDVGSHSVSSKSEEKSSDEAVLSLIEASTGRKFATVDEAKKHLSNLNRLVGDQEVAKARKVAEKYSSLVSGWAKKNGVTNEEAERFLADQFIAEANQEVKSQPVASAPVKTEESNQELDVLKDQVEKLSLLGKYPEAEQYIEEISIIAKSKRVPWTVAFEQSPLKKLAEMSAKEDSKKNPIVTPSNRKGYDTKKVEGLAKKLMTFKGNDDDAVALTKEILGL